MSGEAILSTKENPTDERIEKNIALSKQSRQFKGTEFLREEKYRRSSDSFTLRLVGWKGLLMSTRRVRKAFECWKGVTKQQHNT
jgi:hypothetical protein